MKKNKKKEKKRKVIAQRIEEVLTKAKFLSKHGEALHRTLPHVIKRL